MKKTTKLMETEFKYTLHDFISKSEFQAIDRSTFQIAKKEDTGLKNIRTNKQQREILIIDRVNNTASVSYK